MIGHSMNANIAMQNAEFLNRLMQAYGKLQRIQSLEYQYNQRQLVYQHDKIKLFHYKATATSPHQPPLLVVFATVNRPEILDLFPEQSFIGHLLNCGLDVYLLDWGYPDLQDQSISLNDYVNKYLTSCIDFIKEQGAHKKINLLGVCQGGTICLCYAALYHDLENLILISAPIDFHTDDNIISKVIAHLDVDALIDCMKNISGAWLTQFFILLRPFELIGKKYLRFTDHLNDQALTEKFLRVEKWLQDAPDQTGASFKELLKDLYQENKLIKGDFYLGNKKIDLHHVTLPVLNIMAAEDEIIPLSATIGLNKHIRSSTYVEKIFPSGHIGIYISDKVGRNMPKVIADWLKKEHK